MNALLMDFTMVRRQREDATVSNNSSHWYNTVYALTTCPLLAKGHKSGKDESGYLSLQFILNDNNFVKNDFFLYIFYFANHYITSINSNTLLKQAFLFGHLFCIRDTEQWYDPKCQVNIYFCYFNFLRNYLRNVTSFLKGIVHQTCFIYSLFTDP